jgi:hypothetical protein
LAPKSLQHSGRYEFRVSFNDRFPISRMAIPIYNPPIN